MKTITQRWGWGAWLRASACAAALAVPAARADVRYFDRLPSEGEILSALRGGAPEAVNASANAPVPPGRRTKGIEWAPAATLMAAAAPATKVDVSGPALAFPVNFDAGVARVSKSSLPYLEAVAAAMARSPGLNLTVEGHTDATGDARANFVLSWERSCAVLRVMVERYGIDPQRLRPMGKGMTEPLPSSDPSSRLNRRVQFRVAG
jgi:outer membrane protein OmpA-like peptidoglycan-associated protein